METTTKKKKLKIAFDVDWTLISNEVSIYDYKPNEDTVLLLKLLSKLRNVSIIVWSWTGKEHAEKCVEKLGLKSFVKACYSKNHKGKDENWKHIFEPEIFPDICLDDIFACDLGKLNLIVKNK